LVEFAVAEFVDDDVPVLGFIFVIAEELQFILMVDKDDDDD